MEHSSVTPDDADGHADFAHRPWGTHALLLRLHNGFARAALATRSPPRRDGAAQLLLSCGGDAVGLVASYAKGHSPLSFRASHPKARVFADIRGGGSTKCTSLKLELSGAVPTVTVRAAPHTDPDTDLHYISWWLQVCRCPVTLQLDNLRGDVDLTSPLLRDVTSLSATGLVRFGAVDKSLFRGLHRLRLSGMAFSTLVSAPEELTELHELHINPLTIAQVPLVRGLPHLTELVVNGHMGTFDVAHLACSSELRSLYVSSDHLLRVTGLSHCVALRTCSIRSLYLRTLTFLVDAPALGKVTVMWSGLSDVTGLAECGRLDSVSLLWCKNVRSLAPLKAASTLRTVNATGSGVSSLEGLGQCASLEKLELDYCEALADLTPLAGAPQLRFLSLAGTEVRDVEPLRHCLLLEELNVAWCVKLTDLSPVQAAPRLRVLQAGFSGVSTLSGLNRLNTLQFLDVSYCANLRALCDLSGAAALHTLKAKGSAVRDLSGLETCPVLRVLDVSDCADLQSIPAPLVGACA